MPVGGATHCEQAHRERTCVYDANAAALEKVKKINEFVVAQAVVAEVQNALNRAFGRVLDNPFQVLELQVGNANVANHALLTQLNQRGKCLIYNLLQTARQSRLKLNIVHVDNIDIINIEPFHTLKNAVVGTRNIAVRKVFGGTVATEARRAVREYMVLVGIAILIGIPIAIVLAQRYLMQFYYRIDGYGWVFVVAAVIALAISFLAVLSQTLKAAKANPAVELKKE